MSFRSLCRSMIGNIKKHFLPKTDMEKKATSCKGFKGSYCMLHVTCKKYPMLKVSKEIKTNKID